VEIHDSISETALNRRYHIVGTNNGRACIVQENPLVERSAQPVDGMAATVDRATLQPVEKVFHNATVHVLISELCSTMPRTSSSLSLALVLLDFSRSTVGANAPCSLQRWIGSKISFLDTVVPDNLWSFLYL
jgi:hypothetical protein